MTTEEKTEEQSYPQRLLARATDRERSFLRRSAWMLGYILLGIAMILCAMLWAVVKEIFQGKYAKKPEPEPEDPIYLPLYDYRNPLTWGRGRDDN